VFTGLIEEVGRIASVEIKGRSGRLQLRAPKVAAEVVLGDSVAVNGCCLTVSAKERELLTFDVLGETLERTNLKRLRSDSVVNLERALVAGAPLGGHFVQGHVDCSAEVISFDRHAEDYRLEVALPPEFAHYAAYKGSIAVNGISLTIAELSPKSFAVWIIPHTREHTSIGQVKANDVVNLEFDILAKYVERMLPRVRPKD
jgi:riboflavin synthase